MIMRYGQNKHNATRRRRRRSNTNKLIEEFRPSSNNNNNRRSSSSSFLASTQDKIFNWTRRLSFEDSFLPICACKPQKNDTNNSRKRFSLPTKLIDRNIDSRNEEDIIDRFYLEEEYEEREGLEGMEKSLSIDAFRHPLQKQKSTSDKERSLSLPTKLCDRNDILSSIEAEFEMDDYCEKREDLEEAEIVVLLMENEDGTLCKPQKTLGNLSSFNYDDIHSVPENWEIANNELIRESGIIRARVEQELKSNGIVSPMLLANEVFPDFKTLHVTLKGQLETAQREHGHIKRRMEEDSKQQFDGSNTSESIMRLFSINIYLYNQIQRTKFIRPACLNAVGLSSTQSFKKKIEDNFGSGFIRRFFSCSFTSYDMCSLYNCGGGYA